MTKKASPKSEWQVGKPKKPFWIAIFNWLSLEGFLAKSCQIKQCNDHSACKQKSTKKHNDTNGTKPKGGTNLTNSFVLLQLVLTLLFRPYSRHWEVDVIVSLICFVQSSPRRLKAAKGHRRLTHSFRSGRTNYSFVFAPLQLPLPLLLQTNNSQTNTINDLKTNNHDYEDQAKWLFEIFKHGIV